MSSSFPTEVLGYGSEGSGTEVSVSVPHPAEVLECPAEGSGADWTISFFFGVRNSVSGGIDHCSRTTHWVFKRTNASSLALLSALKIYFLLGFYFLLFLMDFTRTQWTDGHIRFGLGIGYQASLSDVFSVVSS